MYWFNTVFFFCDLSRCTLFWVKELLGFWRQGWLQLENWISLVYFVLCIWCYWSRSFIAIFLNLIVTWKNQTIKRKKTQNNEFWQFDFFFFFIIIQRGKIIETKNFHKIQMRPSKLNLNKTSWYNMLWYNFLKFQTFWQ